MRFEGTRDYVATDDLKVAVNAAIALERPLLVKGEPGTGKTVLALEIAQAIGATLIECIPTCVASGESPRYAPITSGEHRLMKVKRAASPTMA